MESAIAALPPSQSRGTHHEPPPPSSAPHRRLDHRRDPPRGGAGVGERDPRGGRRELLPRRRLLHRSGGRRPRRAHTTPFASAPGTYVEQVTIPAGKDGPVSPLHGASRRRPSRRKRPRRWPDPGDLVRISASRDVTVEGFTISGPLPDALFCSSDTFKRAGVGVDSGGSATIRANHVAQIRSVDSTYRGCQSGAAILVGTLAGAPAPPSSPATRSTRTRRPAVFVEGAGSSAVVAWNVVTGDGPNPIMAQNGIEVDYGADGVVQGNRVSGQVYAPSPLASALLFFQSRVRDGHRQRGREDRTTGYSRSTPRRRRTSRTPFHGAPPTASRSTSTSRAPAARTSPGIARATTAPEWPSSSSKLSLGNKLRCTTSSSATRASTPRTTPP